MDQRHISFIDPKDKSDTKLTRACSLSDLSPSKVTFEESYHSQTNNLVRQFSYEIIVDREAKRSQYKVSQLLKSNNQDHLSVWKKEVVMQGVKPYNSLLKETDCVPYFQENMSLPIQQLSLNDTENSKSRPILAPPKLIADDREPKQSASSSQNSFESSLSDISRCESWDDSVNFKKPPTPNVQSMVLKKRYVIKNEKADTNKNDSLVLTKENHDKNKENEKLEEYDVKKFNQRLRSLVGPVQIKLKKQYRLYNKPLVICIILLFVAIICLAIILSSTDLLNKLCDPHFKTNKVSEELSQRIHGQSSAVFELSKFFAKLDNKASFDILVLVGGIGVGKSYTFEVIRSNLIESIKALDFFPPLYNKESQAYSSLSLCKCNLIRLENLKSDYIEDVIKFVHFLKERSRNNCILIVAIFNPEEIDHNLKRTLNLDKSSLLIKSKFEEANLKPTIVNYVPLNNKALENCIKDLANYTNIELTSDEFENVKKYLKNAESGCKGAYAQIQVTRYAVKKS